MADIIPVTPALIVSPVNYLECKKTSKKTLPKKLSPEQTNAKQTETDDQPNQHIDEIV